MTFGCIIGSVELPMKHITLTNGKDKVIVDDEDYEWLYGFPWTLSSGYAVTNWDCPNKYGLPWRRPTSMHRILTGMVTNIENDLHVDHVNRNKLDNRRSNLRVVTRSENLKNSDLPRGKNPYVAKNGKYFNLYSVTDDNRYKYHSCHKTKEAADLAILTLS